MSGSYNLSLVALSLAIAIIASYTALDLANRVSESISNPRKAWLWLAAGALSMGTGIWSMHFVGMLAFDLPIRMAYDLPITLLSMVIAVGVSAVALFVLRQPEVTIRAWWVGAALMGIGISAMQYTGMMAMRMFPPITYDPLLFLTSVLIAGVASLAALWIALRLRGNIGKFAVPAKLASAGVMGLAITGMHYTGMAAARFAPGSVCLAASSRGLQGATLAAIVGCIAMAILTVTIVLSTLDAHFAVRNARLAASLQVAKDAADAALRQNEKMTAELRAAQSQLVNSARRVGMAEIANSVLHNVGNVLNSVNVSAELIQTQLRQSRFGGLTQAVQVLSDHEGTLEEFLVRDDKGRRLPGYLVKVTDEIGRERRAVADELAALVRSVGHIKEIVATQQSYAGASSLLESVRIEQLVEDALRMNGGDMSRQGITVTKSYPALPELLLDKHLVLQILVNLIANAKQAVEAGAQQQKQIAIRVTTEGGCLRIRVEDNGEGVAPENRDRLFSHGFTTRKAGHGFGLHSSALAATSMGGSLAVESEGSGRGAVFTLELPMKQVGVHEYA